MVNWIMFKKTTLQLRINFIVCLGLLLFFPILSEAQNNLPDRISTVVWSPNGNLIASSSWNGSIYIHAGVNGQLVRTLIGHTDWVSDVSWSPDSNRLASVGGDNALRIWDVGTGATVLVTQLVDSVASSIGTYGLSVLWSIDGNRVITIGVVEEDTYIKVWDSTTGVQIQFVDTGAISDLFWNPDGTKLATPYPEGIILFDAANFEVIKDLKNPEIFGTGHDVFTLAWSPNGTRITAGSLNGTVRIWDVATSQIVADLQGNDAASIDVTTSLVTAINFTTDGTQLSAVSSNGTLRSWNALSGEVLQTTQLSGLAYAAAFSPDGSKVAYGDTGSTAQTIPNPADQPTNTYSNSHPYADGYSPGKPRYQADYCAIPPCPRRTAGISTELCKSEAGYGTKFHRNHLIEKQ